MFNWFCNLFDQVFMAIITACDYNIFLSSFAMLWLIFGSILMVLLIVEIGYTFAKSLCKKLNDWFDSRD